MGGGLFESVSSWSRLRRQLDQRVDVKSNGVGATLTGLTEGQVKRDEREMQAGLKIG